MLAILVLALRVVVGKVILERHCNDQVTHDRYRLLWALRLCLD